jgi:hypothetical protein
MTDEKKKRNTRSWKAESEDLRGLLVEACAHLSTDGSAIPAGPLCAWWAAHCDDLEEGRRRDRAAGLAKLTEAERAALGLEDA